MATDFFIQLDGIDGESNDKGHSKWVEVQNFSHGSLQNISSGRPTDVSGRGQFAPFVFVHQIDKATPKIQQYCMSGQKIAKAVFHICRAIGGAQVPVYELTMENVKIIKAEVKAVVPGGAYDTVLPPVDGSLSPVEVVQLVAGKITWKYTAIKPDNTKDGAVEASFNQVENA